MSSRTEGREGHVDILMYHAIAEGSGPTTIAPELFRAQMEALAASGRAVVSLDDLAAWQSGGKELSEGAVVITFDDGYTDFGDVAWPILSRLGFAATVFLPTGRLGAPAAWIGAPSPPQPLMSWTAVADLAKGGATFGAHSVSHPDLTSLDDAGLEAETRGAKEEMEARLGVPVRHFAPPYGLTDERVRATLARTYATACGTKLARATRTSDPYDLPRLEMFYYKDLARWRDHLKGRGGPYLAARQAARAVKSFIAKPWN